MTDSILRSYYNISSSVFVPFAVAAVPEEGALGLLFNEADGFAIDATTEVSTVAVIDTSTPANNLSNVILDASNLRQAGTSPKMVLWDSAPYVRWTPHNMFLNSGVPATQNVTLVTGFVYTVTVTGAGGGNVTGSSGASGVATTGSPATFTATGTTGTFTLTGSLSTMQLNRGSIATPYLVTTGAIRIGIPQEYDPPELKFGVLVEPAVTNLAVNSEDFTAWGVVSVAITGDTVTAPDGTLTADTFTENTATDLHVVFKSVGTGTPDESCSFFAKAGTRNFVYIRIGNGTDNVSAVFDLSNGTVGETHVGATGAVTSATMRDAGNGWYRCRLSVVITASAFVAFGGAPLASGNTFNSDGDISYLGTSKTWYGWGAQAEGVATVTSYIPALGSTVTRAADVVSALDTTFPGSDTNNTIYLDYKPLDVSSGTRYGWAYWKDANNFYSLAGVTANPTMGNTNAGSPEFAVDLGTLVAGTRTQITIAAKGSDFDGSQDGAAPTAQGTATLTTAYTTLYLGAFGTTGSELNGYIYRMAQVPYQRETVNGDLETWRYNF